jgi:hypothetical protein
MKKFVIGLILISITYPIYSQFRSTEWGDPKYEVRAAEGEPVRDTDNQLGYLRELNGFPVYVRYDFKNRRLETASYIFTTVYTSSRNRYLRDFDFFQEKLRNKYGEPVSDNINWLNDTYKNEPNHYGLAISKGHLEYITFWETDTTRILHSLIGMNGNIQHVIMYASLEAINKSSQDSSDDL